ncbi:MAG: hypothetical protein WDN06_10010 [Asticcacaulis sp.]
MIAAMEADFGSDKVYKATLPATDNPAYNRQMAQLLTPLGVIIDNEPAKGGDFRHRRALSPRRAVP